MIKAYLVLAALVLALGGFGFLKYSAVKKELAKQTTELATANNNLSIAKAANAESEKTIKQLTEDKAKAETLAEEYRLKSQQVKIVEREKIVTIREMAAADPVNRRELSPVLKKAIQDAQNGRRN